MLLLTLNYVTKSIPVKIKSDGKQNACRKTGVKEHRHACRKTGVNKDSHVCSKTGGHEDSQPIKTRPIPFLHFTDLTTG